MKKLQAKQEEEESDDAPTEDYNPTKKKIQKDAPKGGRGKPAGAGIKGKIAVRMNLKG